MRGRSRRCLVVFREFAETIVQNFHKTQSNNPVDERKRILKSAGKQCKAVIFRVVDDTEYYPSPEDIADSEKMYDYA